MKFILNNLKRALFLLHRASVRVTKSHLNFSTLPIIRGIVIITKFVTYLFILVSLILLYFFNIDISDYLNFLREHFINYVIYFNGFLNFFSTNLSNGFKYLKNWVKVSITGSEDDDKDVDEPQKSNWEWSEPFKAESKGFNTPIQKDDSSSDGWLDIPKKHPLATIVVGSLAVIALGFGIAYGTPEAYEGARDKIFYVFASLGSLFGINNNNNENNDNNGSNDSLNTVEDKPAVNFRLHQLFNKTSELNPTTQDSIESKPTTQESVETEDEEEMSHYFHNGESGHTTPSGSVTPKNTWEPSESSIPNNTWEPSESSTSESHVPTSPKLPKIDAAIANAQASAEFFKGEECKIADELETAKAEGNSTAVEYLQLKLDSVKNDLAESESNLKYIKETGDLSHPIPRSRSTEEFGWESELKSKERSKDIKSLQVDTETPSPVEFVASLEIVQGEDSGYGSCEEEEPQPVENGESDSDSNSSEGDELTMNTKNSFTPLADHENMDEALPYMNDPFNS